MGSALFFFIIWGLIAVAYSLVVSLLEAIEERRRRRKRRDRLKNKSDNLMTKIERK